MNNNNRKISTYTLNYVTLSIYIKSAKIIHISIYSFYRILCICRYMYMNAYIDIYIHMNIF